MLKKTMTSVALGGLLVLGGAGAAMADVSYPPSVSCTASPASVSVGEVSTIRCEGFAPNSSVQFTASGGTLGSIALAAAPAVTKTADASGVATASFSASTAGTYTETASGVESDGDPVSASTTVTVTAADGGGAGLPVTGGEVPLAALWLGVGALGLGGIAVAAVVARRRAANNR